MIDVVIPTYKPEFYLFECFESISSQDFDFNLFKVVIVLNGPKEPYYSKIKEWLCCFNFNSELLYSEVTGVSSARNMALNKSISTYITFLDDDDIISFNYLSLLVSKIQPNSIMVSNTYNFVNGLGDMDIENDYLTFKEGFSSSNLIKYRKYLSNACCKLIPLSLVGETRFNENLMQSEDAVFMFAISNRIHKIISTDVNAIYYRRLRKNSASRAKKSIKYSSLLALNVLFCFTLIYFKNPFKYNLFLYLTRLMAVFKRFWLTIK
ncbi:glycosyltransferase family A protein [Acinetobacter sp. NigerLNRRAM0016]